MIRNKNSRSIRWGRAACSVGADSALVGSNVVSRPNFAKIKTCETGIYRYSQVCFVVRATGLEPESFTKYTIYSILYLDKYTIYSAPYSYISCVMRT